MKNTDRLNSQQTFDLAQKEYERVKKFVREPHGNPLVMTPELEAFAEREAVKVREYYRTIAIKKAEDEKDHGKDVRR